MLGTVLFAGDVGSTYAGDVGFTYVGVEHDCEFDGGHDLRCMCRHGYGLCYYDAKRQLLLITDDEAHVTADGLEALL
ncbi:MAG: hypothetical protein RR277_08530 [Rikenellaceae bacterium]